LTEVTYKQINNDVCKWVVACIDVIMSVERCQSKQNGHTKNGTTKIKQCACIESISSMNGEEVYLSQDTPGPRCVPFRWRPSQLRPPTS
jgi:hypothetical protein